MKPEIRDQRPETKDRGLKTGDRRRRLENAYLLLLWNQARRRVVVGSLGRIEFAPGFYLYVGSGGANAVRRVQRHLRPDKRVRWHIDYLTAGSGRMRPVDVYLYPGLAECRLARAVAAGRTGIAGFGSSDCRCRTHLFYSPDLPRPPKPAARG